MLQCLLVSYTKTKFFKKQKDLVTFLKINLYKPYFCGIWSKAQYFYYIPEDDDKLFFSSLCEQIFK